MRNDVQHLPIGTGYLLFAHLFLGAELVLMVDLFSAAFALRPMVLIHLPSAWTLSNVVLGLLAIGGVYLIGFVADSLYRRLEREHIRTSSGGMVPWYRRATEHHEETWQALYRLLWRAPEAADRFRTFRLKLILVRGTGLNVAFAVILAVFGLVFSLGTVLSGAAPIVEQLFTFLGLEVAALLAGSLFYGMWLELHREANALADVAVLAVSDRAEVRTEARASSEEADVSSPVTSSPDASEAEPDLQFT